MGCENRVIPALDNHGESLQLWHKPLLEGLLQGLGNGLSEYCFTNLYLFRELHEYRVIAGDLPCIGGKTYDGYRHLMPLFDLSAVDHGSLLELLKGYDFFFPVSQEVTRHLDGNRFMMESNSDDSDYVYGVERLSTYRGEKLRKKRNLMNNFVTKHAPCCETFGSNSRDDAVEILEEWLSNKGKSLHETDYCQCLEAIRLSEELGLAGLISYAGTDPAGFLLAKEVHPGILAVHFAKGKDRYKGVFQYLFNQLASRSAGTVDFINFEQDLGKANFRQTKRSYCPERLLPKFRVCPLKYLADK